MDSSERQRISFIRTAYSKKRIAQQQKVHAIFWGTQLYRMMNNKELGKTNAKKEMTSHEKFASQPSQPFQNGTSYWQYLDLTLCHISSFFYWPTPWYPNLFHRIIIIKNILESYVFKCFHKYVWADPLTFARRIARPTTLSWIREVLKHICLRASWAYKGQRELSKKCYL